MLTDPVEQSSRAMLQANRNTVTRRARWNRGMIASPSRTRLKNLCSYLAFDRSLRVTGGWPLDAVWWACREQRAVKDIQGARIGPAVFCFQSTRPKCVFLAGTLRGYVFFGHCGVVGSAGPSRRPSDPRA